MQLGHLRREAGKCRRDCIHLDLQKHGVGRRSAGRLMQQVIGAVDAQVERLRDALSVNATVQLEQAPREFIGLDRVSERALDERQVARIPVDERVEECTHAAHLLERGARHAHGQQRKWRVMDGLRGVAHNNTVANGPRLGGLDERVNLGGRGKRVHQDGN